MLDVVRDYNLVSIAKAVLPEGLAWNESHESHDLSTSGHNL
jgi:hypothetical protein